MFKKIQQSGAFLFSYHYKNDNSVDGIKKNYDDIGKALDLLKDKFYNSDLENSSIFSALTDEQERLRKNLDDYDSAIDNLI